jgi:hypothetical protein
MTANVDYSQRNHQIDYSIEHGTEPRTYTIHVQYRGRNVSWMDCFNFLSYFPGISCLIGFPRLILALFCCCCCSEEERAYHIVRGMAEICCIGFIYIPYDCCRDSFESEGSLPQGSRYEPLPVGEPYYS